MTTYRPSPYRPAWSAMGFWKWVALVLLAYAIMAIIPYIQRSADASVLTGAHSGSSVLGGCAYSYAATVADAVVVLKLRLDASCARKMTRPSAGFAHGGDRASDKKMRGTANSLRVSLPFTESVTGLPEDKSSPRALQITLSAENENGQPVTDLILLTQTTPPR